MASKAKASIEITAEDKASRELKKISRQFAKIERDMKNAGKAATVAFTVPVVAGFGASLKAFDTQAKALAQVEAAIKSTGNAAKISFEDLQKEASRLQTKSLFGDEDILANVTAQLQTFTNIAGDEFKRTQQAALDLATRLDGDLKSASIQLGKALNDPVKNLSALSRSGIQFSDSQRETIKALAESGKMAEAQGLILEELEKQYGGAAQAAAEAGLGPMKQLSNRIGDLSERIGEALLPVIEKISPHLDKAITALEKADNKTVAMGVAIAGAAAAAGPALFVFGQLAGAVSTIAGIAAGVSFAPIVAGIAAVAGAGFLLVQNWETVKAAALSLKENAIAAFDAWRERNAETIARISASFASIRETFGRVVAALGQRTQEAIGWLNGFLEPLGGIEGAWQSLQIVVGAVIDTLTGLIGDWFAGLAANFAIVADVLEGNKTAWEGLKEIVGNVASFMLAKVKESLGNIKTAFTSIDWASLGGAIMDGIKSGIANGAKSVADAATNAASNALNAVKSKLGIRSPSREFAKLGKFAMAGLSMGIATGAPLAAQSAEQAARDVLASASGVMGGQGPVLVQQAPQTRGGLGGFGDGPGEIFIPGRQEIDAIASFYDERLALLTERELEHTQVAKDLELRRTNEIADIRSQQIAGFGQSFDAILGLTRSFAGEQSGIYQGLFAVSKGFAIAESIIKIQQGIANALSLPFPANLGAAATVAGQAAGIVSTIKGTNLQSFEGGGFTGMGARTGGVDGKGGIPAIVHPNETVIDHTKGQSMGGVTVNLTINGNPSEDIVARIKSESVALAIKAQTERERRGGSRA
ncbi:phage tail protein [Roseibacillus ishigakijimensis]|uniref:Phage tail length tape measure family protein n=1 Tax=Roseibacillus ishigakijimensis TaxID=454146 RepID=A0A934RP93_9BACT|nr:phage tail length tape measure family protein [Roseibacillus ishigakijimensis]MBK1835004.1 phage tail length tape measure family protein [Roseibacillus ishigakijimensis]